MLRPGTRPGPTKVGPYAFLGRCCAARRVASGPPDAAEQPYEKCKSRTNRAGLQPCLAVLTTRTRRGNRGLWRSWSRTRTTRSEWPASPGAVFTMITVQRALWLTRFGTFPSRNFFRPLMPRLPTTTTSTDSSSATRTMAWAGSGSEPGEVLQPADDPVDGAHADVGESRRPRPPRSGHSRPLRFMSVPSRLSPCENPPDYPARS